MVCSRIFWEIPRTSFMGKLGRQYIKIFRKIFNSYRGDGTAAHARQLPGGTAATFRSLLIVGVPFLKSGQLALNELIPTGGGII